MSYYADLAKITEKRTNSEPISPGHYKWMRSRLNSEVERANQLDPLNPQYFNVLFFFYTTPQVVGKSLPQRDLKGAFDLCLRTIAMQGMQEDNPSAWMTQLMANQALLQLMCENPSVFTRKQAELNYTRAAYALQQYEHLLQQRVQQQLIKPDSRRYRDMLEMYNSNKTLVEKMPEIIEKNFKN